MISSQHDIMHGTLARRVNSVRGHTFSCRPAGQQVGNPSQNWGIPCPRWGLGSPSGALVPILSSSEGSILYITIRNVAQKHCTEFCSLWTRLEKINVWVDCFLLFLLFSQNWLPKWFVRIKKKPQVKLGYMGIHN